MTENTSSDHRTKVGKQRRERTRLRILDAALRVFAKMGTDAPLIDDFIAEAGISRGTFYNYFRTTHELLQVTVEWISADIIDSIEVAIVGETNPLLRLTIGLRCWLEKAKDEPNWAAFVARPDFIKNLPLSPVKRDLLAGLELNIFHFPNERVALDLVTGTLIMAMHGSIQANATSEYITNVIQIVLQGLGVDPLLIEMAIASPLPKLQNSPNII
ncbi:TetR/AcrR family transcriptional regulator [Vibrio fluvialis]|nr:TetR/AcrR family transcriptional regulator [Vibrio fluvialis]